ncbi:MAG TPA: hypothetical protein VMM79_20745 [Longimicrobiales bacterium]|nr:hypothetical protein [Longimicrobiales bacterium]
MPIDRNFHAAYQALEERMRDLADTDGDVYLPNLAPDGPVECVLICMEPSLDRWAGTPGQAEANVAAGLRNFLWSMEDFILHYCAREYLCRPGERYHITDLSKGAMRVNAAGVDRFARYDRWYDLLLEELALILRADATVVAIGRMVADHLRRRAFPWEFTQVMHYSGQAAAARRASIRGRKGAFERFANSVSGADLVECAEALLSNPIVQPDLRTRILGRLRDSELSESRRQLMFIYMTVFCSIRDAHPPTLRGAV